MRVRGEQLRPVRRRAGARGHGRHRADGPTHEERIDELTALYRWYSDWSATARAVIARRDYLMAMGLAERARRKVARPCVARGWPCSELAQDPVNMYGMSHASSATRSLARRSGMLNAAPERRRRARASARRRRRPRRARGAAHGYPPWQSCARSRSSPRRAGTALVPPTAGAGRQGTLFKRLARASTARSPRPASWRRTTASTRSAIPASGYGRYTQPAGADPWAPPHTIISVPVQTA